MFSFHKPRVYRSTEGCCICRAKSSSSRFTDSKKYEDDSVKCFNLDKPRQGEICNACVLLVKRFKRLPVGSNRHWGHVVDARIGPGIKSLSKFKKLREECQQRQGATVESSKMIYNKISTVSEKFCKIFRKNKKKKLAEKNFDTKRDDNSSDENSSHGTSESLNSDDELNYRKSRHRLSGIRRRKCKKPRKLSKRVLDSVRFFDENDWKLVSLCCGTVFENNRIGALIVDYDKCKPCPDHVNSFCSVLTKASFPPFEAKSDRNEFHVPHQNGTPATSHQAIATKFNQMPNTMVYNTSVAALKKHQIFYKRQSENTSHSEDVPAVPDNIQFKTVSNRQVSLKSPSSVKNKHSFLHKIKPDKIPKPVLTGSVEKDKTIDVPDSMKAPIVNANLSGMQPVETGVATKFSDNSSDSGFDENLPDQNGQTESKERKILIRPIESLFVSSTIPITLPAPPGSQTTTIQTHKTIHTPQNIALLNNHKVRAIYNTTPDGGLNCVPISSGQQSTSTNATSANYIIPHKKFLYVKSKQSAERPSNN